MPNHRRRKADVHPAAAIHSMPQSPTTVDTIRERAFEIYEARGRESGHDLDDWLQAERQLRTDGDVARG
jgi:hypothetical protein